MEIFPSIAGIPAKNGGFPVNISGTLVAQSIIHGSRKQMAQLNKSIIRLVRWIARSASIVMLLFWGAFFAEHLAWFFNSIERPPFFVWVLQTVHLVLLIGYLISLKHEIFGSLTVTVSLLVFLSLTAGGWFLPLFSFGIIPPILYLSCRLMERKTKPVKLSNVMN